MKLGENLEHDMGYLSVLEFRGNLFPVMSIEFLKLTQVPAILGAKKIIKWIMWMDKVLIVIQVKKELLMGKVLMVIQVKKELKLNKMMTALPMLYINKWLRYFLSKKAFDIVNATQNSIKS